MLSVSHLSVTKIVHGKQLLLFYNINAETDFECFAEKNQKTFLIGGELRLMVWSSATDTHL